MIESSETGDPIRGYKIQRQKHRKVSSRSTIV